MIPEELKQKEDKAFQELEKKYQKLRQLYNQKCKECDDLRDELEDMGFLKFQDRMDTEAKIQLHEN